MNPRSGAKLLPNSVARNKELREINKFRKDMGMKPLVVKLRKCNRCLKEFETIVGYVSNFSCGCYTEIKSE